MSRGQSSHPQSNMRCIFGKDVFFRHQVLRHGIEDSYKTVDQQITLQHLDSEIPRLFLFLFLFFFLI